MTREQAKEMFRSDIDAYGKPRAIMSKIDKIYDSFENCKPLHDIKNKMSPIVHLISILERDGTELNNIDLTNVKRSVNELCNINKYKL